MVLEKRELINHFFDVHDAKFPAFGERVFRAAMIVLGFGIFVVLFFQNTLIIGVICIGISVYAAYRWLKPYYDGKNYFKLRPPVTQMHQWLIEDLNIEIKNKAVTALAIDPNKLLPENFIIIPYPVFWQIGGAEVKRRMGEDGKFCYSVWNVQVLAITDFYLSIYSCTYDWSTNRIFGENTYEYFYDDISAIKNDTEPLPYKLMGQDEQTVGAGKIMKIINMSGDSLSLIADIPSLNSSPDAKTSIDKATQVVRIILRNRRYGEVVEQPKEETKPDVEHH